ncbi:hypothetical protein DPEC_G00223770 [Dallia pectoralis]|uniref:Uncharacterized protein n=1 Tax=Dallia pectoralis TaxID=75939 RepID=A0ACC2G0B2_DALPE|nr:hypothetical protein DPEC_G00223770 [Dallia pectoralis]
MRTVYWERRHRPAAQSVPSLESGCVTRNRWEVGSSKGGCAHSERCSFDLFRFPEEPQERPLARTQSPHHPSSQSPFSPASPVSLMFPPVLKPVHLAAS